MTFLIRSQAQEDWFGAIKEHDIWVQGNRVGLYQEQGTAVKHCMAADKLGYWDLTFSFPPHLLISGMRGSREKRTHN